MSNRGTTRRGQFRSQNNRGRWPRQTYGGSNFNNNIDSQKDHSSDDDDDADDDNVHVPMQQVWKSKFSSKDYIFNSLSFLIE